MVRFIRVTGVIVALLATAIGLLYRPEWVIEQRSDNIWLVALLFAGGGLLLSFWYGAPPLKLSATQAEKLARYVQRVGTLLLVGFILLSLQLLRYQFVVAKDFQEPFFTPQNELVQDPRIIRRELATQRGRIFDTYGNQAIGIEVSKEGLVKRTYQNPYIASLVGYFSPLQFGNSGLEAAYDDYLTGRNGTNPFLTWQRQALHLPVQGNDLYLTIEPNLQRLTTDTLGNLPGSIVLLDADTGAVLAMVGNPRFNPAELAFDPTIDDSKWADQTKAIQKRWQELTSDKRSPLLPRATQGLYTPGSTFKTVTLAAAIDSGKTNPDSTWNDTGFLVVDSYRINDPNRPDPGRTTWTTREGYMFSLNSVFAQLGLAVGGQDLTRYMEQFGFNQRIPFDVPVAASRPFIQQTYFNSRVAVAETGFGQGQLQVTPLQMALIAAAMGRDDGAMPKPYMVKEIRTPEKVLIKATQPQTWLTPVSNTTARTVHDIMIASATDGWVGRYGGGLKDTGAVVGGKTGTAEVGDGTQNAWYIAWATKGERTFAIAVVVERQPGGEGLALAMPRANTVLRAVLAQVK